MSFRSQIDVEWQKNLPREVSHFIGGNPQALDETLPIVDRILEPQTVAHFLEFTFSGNLPTGGKTSLPLITVDIIQKYLTVPYSKWAPGPHDKFGLSPFDSAMVHIGSHEDSERLVPLQKGVHSMKSRIWEGILPLSDNRWRQKQLDDPANHYLACRHLGHVIEVFNYLQHEPIAQALSETFNLVQERFKDFDRVFNAHSDREKDPPIQLAALWEEYMTAHFISMTTRCHSWVISKLEKLKDINFELLAAINPPAGDIYTFEQMEILNRVQDLTELAFRADVTIYVNMPKSDPPATVKMLKLTERHEKYNQTLRRQSRQKIMEDVTSDIASGQPPRASNSPSRLLSIARAQRKAQNEVRAELRQAPLELPSTEWIWSLVERLKKKEDKSWGFAIYRLTYKETDDQWAEFKKKVEADVGDWGDNEKGAEDIKHYAKLQWFDGKVLGIPEGDVTAAKKHFATLFNVEGEDSDSDNDDDEGNATSKPWYMDDIFMVADSESYASYMYESPFASSLGPADTGGFLTAVDVPFDPEDRGPHAEESPHYPGKLRILGSLIYPDLYAMSAAQTQGPEELWPLAMNHPELIYTGPTVTAQVAEWKKATAMKLKLLEIAVQSYKRRSAAVVL